MQSRPVQVTLPRSRSPDKERDGWPSNRISTTKYEWYNFLFKNLWEQLHKFSTVYFLSISALMYVGEKTDFFVGTIKYFTTLAQQVVLMILSGGMALRDDLQRREADRQINNSEVEVYTHDGFQTVKWEAVRVGDVLKVRREREFPADLVPLYSSGDRGAIFVSTANLDGETNLKTKGALPETQEALAEAGQFKPESLKTLECEVGAEPPKDSIHDFKGFVELPAGKGRLSLGPEQLLLRGTVLRNTSFVVGVVVYTGANTRMVLNSREAPMKQSNIERTTNSVMWIVLLTQAVLALVSDIAHLINRPSLEHHWYLVAPQTRLPTWLAYWLTFFVLYSNLMPITLYGTVDVCNFLHAYFIKHDKSMCYIAPGDAHPEHSFPAGVRSTNLCQELGQVSYIFSDKTGTLTQNMMELKRVFIAGFGPFGDKILGLQLNNGAPSFTSATVKNFLEVLSVCHTVMVTDGPKYEAESPDDEALVVGAKKLGWELRARVNDKVTVDVSEPHPANDPVTPPEPTLEEYTIVATNAFTSDRKRMSVIAKKGEEYFVLAKGADNVMIGLLAKGQDSSMLMPQLTEFSKQGLRTLVMCRRKLEGRDFVERWLERYRAANADLGDRQAELAKVANEVEVDLEICGATGIEDKLQDGVPQTIGKIRTAGVKFWVLTGDKLETAKEIGFSANVLSHDMVIHEVDRRTGDVGVQLRAVKQKCESEAKRAADVGDEPSPQALVITGDALADVTAASLDLLLVDVARVVPIVIACRVSPLQKAQMVGLVRDHIKDAHGRRVVTLAIGDGANDVPMIQTAEVGIGIAGREGRQSVNNSDFAIGQFMYLERLMLVHGRWDYLRACKYTLFTFWRNAVQVFMIAFYTYMSGFSGTSLFEDSIRITFNGFASVPIVATGIFDQDVDETVALECPWLYRVGREQVRLSFETMAWALTSAFFHSVILQLIWYAAFDSMAWLGVGDYYSFGTACFTGLLLDVFYRTAFLNYTHNRYTVWSIGLCLAGYVCYLVFLCVTPFMEPNMFQVPLKLAGTAPFWVCLLCAPLIAAVGDTAVEFALERVSETQKALYWDRRTALDHAISNQGSAPEPTFSDIRDWKGFGFLCWLLCLKTEKKGEDDAESLLKVAPQASTPVSSGGEQEVPTPPQIAAARAGGSTYSSSSLCRRSGKSRFKTCGMPTEHKNKCEELGLDLSDFAQQRTGTWISVDAFLTTYSRFFNMLLAFGAGLILVCTGCLLFGSALTVQKVTVGYWPRQASSESVLGALDVLTLVKSKDCYNSTCTVSVDLSGLDGDIYVGYMVGPFYQNHNDYESSEVIEELQGGSFDEVRLKREKICYSQMRIKSGREIVPCGMKATSMFNDTFTFDVSGTPIRLEESAIAWPSDIARYNLQSIEDYTTDVDGVQWLTETYPTVIDPSLGAKTPRFVSWMRPSAKDYVLNLLGVIPASTIKRKKLNMSAVNVRIRDDFPVSAWGGYKRLVFSERSSLGGSEPELGLVLVVFGVLSLAYGFVLRDWIKSQDDLGR